MKNEYHLNRFLEEFNLSEDTIDTKETHEKLRYFLDVALAERKFEISLYWRRTCYYIIFIGILFAAFCFSTFNNALWRCSHHSLNVFSYIFAVLGYIVSVSWFLSNKGSKYWQDNWESHIGYLSRAYNAPLFNMMLRPDEFEVFAEYPYSISKLNMFVSLITFVLWPIILIILTFFNRTRTCCNTGLIAILIVFSSILIYMVIEYFGKGFVAKQSTINKGTGDNNRIVNKDMFYND